MSDAAAKLKTKTKQSRRRRAILRARTRYEEHLVKHEGLDYREAGDQAWLTMKRAARSS